MASFRTRIGRAAGDNGRVVLAVDHTCPDPGERAAEDVELLHRHVCGIKMNLHLLLPLGARQVSEINRAAHRHGLQSIADIKLNDIGETNRVAARRLWDMGFDAVIANPVMGRDALGELVSDAHREDRGVIALCHMSAPHARMSYETDVRAPGRSKLYELFLDWAVSQGADGVIAGATFPDVIRYCRDTARGALDIYSPGVGVQGGGAADAVAAGSDYLIVGRSIIGADDPQEAAQEISRQARACGPPRGEGILRSGT